MVQRRSRVSRRKNRSRVSRRKNRSRVSRRKNRSRVSRRKNRSRVFSRKGRRKKIKKMKSKLYQSGGSSNLGSFYAPHLLEYGLGELKDLAIDTLKIPQEDIDKLLEKTPYDDQKDKLISLIIKFREEEQQKRVLSADARAKIAELKTEIARLKLSIHNLGDKYPAKKRRLMEEKNQKERTLARIEKEE